MHTYLVQLDPTWEDRAANHQRAREWIAKAAPAPGSLIVLPETFSTGFSLNTAITAEPENGPTEQFLAEIAREYRCAVLGGLVTRKANGLCANQSLTLSPEGHILARYDKNRPFSMIGEHQKHQAGTSVCVFEWQGIQIAPLICYDLRFPELARQAVQAGAEMIIYIAAWPIKRAHHWVTLLQARAIENLAWVIGVNRCGSDPDFTYPGRSLVVDPHGIITADAADREQVISTSIDIQVARDWRSQFPALHDAQLL